MIVKQRHVAIFLPDLGGGGGERVMVNLSKGFASLCGSVDIVLANAKGPFVKEVPESVRIVDLKSGSTSKALPKLVGYLKKSSPDILFATLNSANVVALVAKILIPKTRTKFYIREANTASQHLAGGRSFKNKCLNGLVRKLYPGADRIIAVSSGVAEDLRSYLGKPGVAIDVIHNPVIIPDRGSLTLPRDAHEWFVENDRPVILGVGRLEKQKNFELLIRAFNLVRKDLDARLIILGEGSRRGELEALVKHLGLDQSVALPGFQVNPYPYMAHANLFVLSSLWEGFPNTLVEALACGCPVVSTDCPSGPAEILGEETFGDLVPVDNVDAMASTIVAALSRQHDKAALIDRALDFSLDETARKYLG